MELIRPAARAGGRMQWLCGGEVVALALETADALSRSHGIAADLWRIDDWEALAREGVACEAQWRRGTRAAVDSRFERLLAPTRGPILAITRAPRAVPELLRAFAPEGRRYLSLSGGDVDELRATALRLDDEAAAEWARLAAI